MNFEIKIHSRALYDVELVRRVIVDISRKYSRYHTRNMATTLRIYLRFLIARGECRPWLDQAVPSMANWRLAQLPRYLEPAKVERLIAACDPATPLGIRDRAIILLLARLGLRASDIVDMRLEDVEWEEGTLRARGKGRLEIRLPLPQEVGDALLDYLNGVRVCVASNRMFLRSIPPFGPLVTSSAVSRVVERALKRSGITDAPSRGAHMLRHSAATNMLRAGATGRSNAGCHWHHSAPSLDRNDGPLRQGKHSHAAPNYPALARRCVMLSHDVECFVSLKRAAGYKFNSQDKTLRDFAEFATASGDQFVRAQRVYDWATCASTPYQRRERLLTVRRFALTMRAEASCHEVPAADAIGPWRSSANRPTSTRQTKLPD